MLFGLFQRKKNLLIGKATQRVMHIQKKEKKKINLRKKKEKLENLKRGEKSFNNSGAPRESFNRLFSSAPPSLSLFLFLQHLFQALVVYPNSVLHHSSALLFSYLFLFIGVIYFSITVKNKGYSFESVTFKIIGFSLHPLIAQQRKFLLFLFSFFNVFYFYFL